MDSHPIAILHSKIKVFVMTLGVLSLHTAAFAGNDYDDIVASLLNKNVANNVGKIAVINFSYIDADSNSRGAQIVSERILNRIVNTGKIKVIERNLLGKVLEELKIQNSGVIESSQAKQIGKLAGVDAILTGTMYKTGLDEVEINSRLIEAGTGEILSSSSKKVRMDWLESLPQNKWAEVKAPESGGILCNLGVREMDQMLYERAAWLFTEAIAMDDTGTCGTNEHGFAYKSRAKIYSIQNNAAAAIKDYDKYVSLNPSNPEGYTERGVIYGKNKDYDRAIDNFVKAIYYDPQYARAYNGRGSTYALTKNYEKGIEDFNKAIELNPNYAQPYSNRGSAYIYMGEYDKAIEDFSHALALNPSLAETYYNRGLAYREMGDAEKSEQDIKKYTELTGRKTF
mgnify:CR=1 FL=1